MRNADIRITMFKPKMCRSVVIYEQTFLKQHRNKVLDGLAYIQTLNLVFKLTTTIATIQ